MNLPFSLQIPHVMIVSLKKHQPLEIFVRERSPFRLQNVFASRENPFDCCTGGNGGIVLNKEFDQNRLSQESHISVILLGVLVQPGRH